MKHSAVALLILSATATFAQSFRIQTVAGFGTFGGDGGAATAALVNPRAVALASDGSIYVADPDNFRIRKISVAGTISTIIGTGESGFTGDGGSATLAKINGPSSLALDSSGNLYFTDDGNWRIREITSAGLVKTVAGNGACGTPTAGQVAASAPLCDVEAVAVDAQGQVYFSSSSKVWSIRPDGTLTAIAGNGGYGNTGDGGFATLAEIGYPGSLAFDRDGLLHIGDFYNSAIRKVALDGRISSINIPKNVNATAMQLAFDASGTLHYVDGTTRVYKIVQGTVTTALTLTSPADAVCLAISSSGTLYLCSINLQRLFKSVNSDVTTVAGAYPYSVEVLPAPASSVRLHLNPLLIGLAVDSSNNVYFPELDGTLKQRINKLLPDGTLSFVPTPAKLPTNGDFTVQAIAIAPNQSIYFSTFNQVYRADGSGGVTLVAGAPGFNSPLGDNGPATLATLANPSSLAFDSNGNLYISEPFNSRVRKVNPQGIITTFAGTGQAGYSGDNGPASSARLSTPVDVKTDPQGSVYIADLTASVVRKVAPNGIITTIAGTGTQGISGDGGPAIAAQLSGAAAIALDASGNLFIADRPSAASTISPATDNNRIRMVNTAGIMSTIAGPSQGYNGEGISSQIAAMGGPVALAADALGNIYVNESSSQRIRKLTPAPASSGVVISSINTAYGNSEISQNAWIEIKGLRLAPTSVGSGIVWSDAPDFQQGRMPTQLGGVSVTVNGKPAFIYFVSPGQINVLTPLDSVVGDVSVVVTSEGVRSDPFTIRTRSASPSFLRFGSSTSITATHANGALLGPASLSAPGYTFTPAAPGEVVVLYGVGFGLPSATLVNGSSSQSGALPTLPPFQIDGITANVQFAGINGAPGLYQFNVVVPPQARDGDLPVTVSYGGTTTPLATLTVKR